MAEKNEQPTPKKIRDERKKGNVFKNEGVPLLLLITLAMEFIFMMMERGIARLQQLFTVALSFMTLPFITAAKRLTQLLAVELSIFLAPVLGVAIGARLLGNWLQFGFLIAPESAMPKFERLNPLQKIQQMFSSRELAELVSSLLKFLTIVYASYSAVYPHINEIVFLAASPLMRLPQVLRNLVSDIFHHMLILLAVWTALDFGLQKYLFIKTQRMSLEEVRRENKDTEGDPHIKSYRRSLMMSPPPVPVDVPQPGEMLKLADVVLNDAASQAVLLRYEQQNIALPHILFKQQGKDAVSGLLDNAGALNIPVIDAPQLVHLLMQYESGQAIPRQAIAHTAYIYNQLQQLKNREPEPA
ncbi:EscU/YscU/HrcU family type III secretion system export apparatus switch protein [Kosakonia sacchari]|uniref:EscU/YscU/HrcU family type III secretion system export apparatus switch protein n=1 Tax=Kosakonia sacchari TaxID=1158459 RepID=UPI0030C07A61